MAENTEIRRQDRERAFHDDVYDVPDHGPMDEGGRGRFYAVAAPTSRYYVQLVTDAARGRSCLEYGCGTGIRTCEVAEVAQRVTGIDVSKVAIDRARQAAAAAGVAEKVTFEVQEAESLPYANGSFDLAFGNSVLHHLDLRATVPEMVRVLRPGGTAVFLEPMGHNPAINLYRRRTPHMRTPDERPLRREDIEFLADAFGEARFEFSALSTLASVLLPARMVEAAGKGLTRLDRFLLKGRSPLRSYAWLCVMVLQAKV